MKNYTLKLYKTSGKVETVRTKKRRRFLKIIRTINWQSGYSGEVSKDFVKKTYIKISYGKKVCADGCLCEFYNDGYYETKEEFLEIFGYFDKDN